MHVTARAYIAEKGRGGLCLSVTRQVLRSGRKFAQMLEGARQIFLALDFQEATVDDIARAAGVSKATLFSYFPDK